jgi:hypothetical protein
VIAPPPPMSPGWALNSGPLRIPVVVAVVLIVVAVGLLFIIVAARRRRASGHGKPRR